MNDRTHASGEFTGRHMLIIMLAFFGVIIAVNLTMAMLANTTWTGLEVKNSYVASQDFNKKLAKAAKQQALGWTSSLTQSGGELVLELRDRNGKGISSAAVEARFQRPVHERDDFSRTFTYGGDGRYSVPAPEAAGRWVVDVRAISASGERYRQIFRLMIKAE